MTTGAKISRQFFERAVHPIVEEVLDGRGYLAGRLGSGSDVLGFDDTTSTDHDFGCRLTVLVDDRDRSLLIELDQALSAGLPREVDGRPTRFPTSWDDQGTHNVDLHTVHDFARSRLGFDLRSSLGAAQWLCMTGQSVLEVTAGPVFHDTTEAFEEIRKTLEWYPDDLWYYVMTSGWNRLGQELPFVGRTGQVGDEVGSRVITSRLCRDIAHLTFVVARTWAPYSKWAGVALRNLPDGAEVAGQLEAVQAATSWHDRQRCLVEAIEALAERHRLAGLELPTPVLVPFYDRPFVVTADHVLPSLRQRIVDPSIQALPLLGSIEQWSDNVDLLTSPDRRSRAVSMYELE